MNATTARFDYATLKANLIIALACVGVLYFLGLYPKTTPEKEFLKCKARAEKGDAVSQHLLGVFYGSGHGTDKDVVEAAKWFRKAAEQNYAAAQHRLSLCYYFGVGVMRDEVEELKWVFRAAEQNHAVAQYDLGMEYRCDPEVPNFVPEFAKWFRKMDEQDGFKGFSSFRPNAGYGGPLQKDDSVAAAWFRKAAELNYAPAHYELGLCYRHGAGVGKDYVEAYGWLNVATKAAMAAAAHRDDMVKEMSEQQIAAGKKRTKELQMQIAARLNGGGK